MSSIHRIAHPPTRLGALGAALLCAATLAACGSDDPKDGATGAAAAYDGALKFAKCMRDHGVEMPDPKQGPNGEVGIAVTQAPGAGPGPDELEKADAACRKFLGKPDTGPRDPEQEAKQRDAFLAFAKCMRGRGIDMPDPKVGGGRVTMQLGGPGKGPTRASGPDPGAARFRAAERACRGKLGAAAPGMALSTGPGR